MLDSPTRTSALLIPLAVAAGLLTACGAERPAAVQAPARAELVAYDSCDAALAQLRAAITPYIGPSGVDVGRPGLGVDQPATAEDGAAPLTKSAGPGGAEYSGTNVQEAGIGEPDLVKTDGERIVALRGDRLQVVDAATRRLTAEIPLDTPGSWGTEGGLLLSGDIVLVLSQRQPVLVPYDSTRDVDDGGPETLVTRVDLAAGAVTGTFTFEGTRVDARQYGTTARLVVSSAPRLEFPQPKDGQSPSQRAARNREAVAGAAIDSWLPRYHYTGADGTEVDGTIGCEALRHAFTYSATSMLTVLTFDMTAPLGTGSPVTIVADGQTVYGSASSLYVANDRSAFVSYGTDPAYRGTEVFRFDVSQPGPPVFAASGTVPGFVLNQYSMSELDGLLRIATTTAPRWTPPDAAPSSESAVYVMEQSGAALKVIGHVGGLGKGERIYAVRFTGATAYVVTFRRTDPLYVVDLTDPAVPVVVGELKTTGYSAYLHPVGPGRLVGVGQEATETGATTGAQVSLFDVSDPAAPAELDEVEVPGGYTEAESDPHAFLYWEPARLLVVPVRPGWRGGADTAGGALLVRVEEDGLTEIATVVHDRASDPYTSAVRRSLVIGDELWTYSGAGLLATAITGGEELGWVAA